MIVRGKRIYGIIFRYALILGVFVFIFANATFTSVQAMTNPTINFQGRLLNNQGAVVPDGYYNMQFKIYQDGDGQSANNATGSPAGTLRWTEDWTNAAGRGITVRNGYMSVELGSVNPFASQVDWDKDTLWLSANIGNTNVSCTPIASCGLDGEMLPMKRFSSAPYAMNAGMLNGLSASDFIRNSTTLQTANIAVQSANATSVGVVVSGATSQSVDIFQVRSAATANPLLAIGSTGDITVQPASNSVTAFTVKTSDGSNSAFSVDNQNSRVTVGNASTTGTGLTAYGAVSSTTGYQIGGSNILTGNALTFTSATGATIQSAQNQALAIQGGNASTTNANGSNLILAGGAGNGSGAQGLVIINTPTFTTTTADPNCFTGGSLVATSCTIAQSSVDNTSAILVGFNTDDKTATLPGPTNAVAGRVIYVTASTTSSDFTLSVNGGGQGNQVAMRKNTTATMIWNGIAWTAAGASSSTTMQAAYDNTLQSAGGAELIVSKTSATNGLTIRDSSTSPVNGTLLSVQTSSAAGLLSVNGNVAEYSSNSGAEAAGSTTDTFPADTWLPINGATVSRYTTAGNNIATGKGSVSIATNTTAGSGARNRLSTTLVPNMTYNVSFGTRLLSGNFSDLEVYYSVDGSTASAPCATTKSPATSIWTKINCTFIAPTSGIVSNNSILIRQASSGTARTFYVDNLSVTIAADFNYATDGSANDGDNFTSNWSFVNATSGVGSVTRSTTDGEDASDSAQVTLSTGAANAGIRNRLSVNPLPSTLYRMTAYAKVTSGTFTNFKIRYSPDGSTGSSGNYTDCVDYNTRTLTTTTWTKITCFVQTSSTPATNPHAYFVEESAQARTFRVDAFTMTLTTNTASNVQIGGGENGGPTTLLTLDKAASAPIAINNDALLGSMYYDTTLGKLQCYEADGWGACGSSPDTIVTISPEFTNAVLHGTGIGTMVSDLCSDTLNINDGSSGQPNVCGTNETFNFYRWTSPQPSAQTYGVYVTYQLPASFKSFESGSTSIIGRTDSANSTMQYQVFRNDSSSGLVPCGPTVLVSSGDVSSWQPGIATGTADPSTCGFVPGNSIVFRINVTASQNANAYIGNLNFKFSNK